MATIDIRGGDVEKVTEIIFDEIGSSLVAYTITLRSKGSIDIEAGSDYVVVNNISNLIKALQKAQELGWDK